MRPAGLIHSKRCMTGTGPAQQRSGLRREPSSAWQGSGREDGSGNCPAAQRGLLKGCSRPVPWAGLLEG